MTILIEIALLEMLVNLIVSFKASNKSIKMIISEIIKTLKFKLMTKIILFTFNFPVFKSSVKY